MCQQTIVVEFDLPAGSSPSQTCLWRRCGYCGLWTVCSCSWQNFARTAVVQTPQHLNQHSQDFLVMVPLKGTEDESMSWEARWKMRRKQSGCNVCPLLDALYPVQDSWLRTHLSIVPAVIKLHPEKQRNLQTEGAAANKRNPINVYNRKPLTIEA